MARLGARATQAWTYHDREQRAGDQLRDQCEITANESEHKCERASFVTRKLEQLKGPVINRVSSISVNYKCTCVRCTCQYAITPVKVFRDTCSVLQENRSKYGLGRINYKLPLRF